MLSFAAFTPHPPLIIPEIGGENCREVKKTIEVMGKLSEDIAESDPLTIIVISPHGLIHQSEMLVGRVSKMYGNFENFDHPEIEFNFPGNIELADQIIKQAQKNDIPVTSIDHNNDQYFLDHGILVPLYYLTKELGLNIKIVPVSYSMLSRAKHFSFGQSIGEVINQHPERIALVASGDLSHRLLENHLGNCGREFDHKIVESMKKYDVDAVLNIDEELQELAGECGYRSLLILFGALDGKNVKPKVLSYEGPFGVGYAVAEFSVE